MKTKTVQMTAMVRAVFLKKYKLIGLITLATFCFMPHASAQGVLTYQVDWPARQLEGTFTLGIGSGFAQYNSSEAAGTLGTGVSQINLTHIGFWVQPNFAELYIYGQNNYGQNITDGIFDSYPPIVDGAYISWTDVNAGWQALVTQGAANGLTIRVVPEPSDVALFNVGLLTLILFRQAQKRSRIRLTSREACVKTILSKFGNDQFFDLKKL